MPNFEQRDFSGDAVITSLVGTVTALSTSWQINDATGWPTGTAGPFYAVFNRAGSASNPDGSGPEEKVLVSNVTGTTVTLLDSSQRGVDGTTAQAWATPTSFAHCFTADDAFEANMTVSQTLGQVQGKGDLLVGRSANRLQRVAPAADGTLLQYDSTQPGGMIGGPIPDGSIDAGTMFVAGVIPASAIASDAFTYAQISALGGSDLVEGRVVYQTDVGTGREWIGEYLFNGTAWVPTTQTDGWVSLTSASVNGDTDSTWNTFSWTAVEDPLGMLFTSTITIPTGMGGVWTVEFGCRWSSNGTGNRQIRIVCSAAGNVLLDERGAPPASVVTNQGARTLRLAGGETIQAQRFQTSGGNLALAPADGFHFFTARRVHA